MIPKSTGIYILPPYGWNPLAGSTPHTPHMPQRENSSQGANIVAAPLRLLIPHSKITVIRAAGVLVPAKPIVPANPIEGQPLIRNRAQHADLCAELPSTQRPADRTVRIADFSWVLPPDTGPKVPYPRLGFLIGAAIASSESGEMEVDEIVRWIRERYPRISVSLRTSIRSTLSREKQDFANTRAGEHGRTGKWTLCNPHQFGGCYAASFRQRRSRDAASGESTCRAVQSSSSDQPFALGSAGEAHIAPALSVEIGGRTLTLPPCGAGQKLPPLRLLCGFAIALGHEQGVRASEIASWIADRYAIQDGDTREKQCAYIRSMLSSLNDDFKQNKHAESDRGKKGRPEVSWTLNNPVQFAASYKALESGQESFPEADQQECASQRLTRKRSRLPSPEELCPAVVKAEPVIDRTVHIGSYTTTLPPDTGWWGWGRPALILLIGYALSSETSGAMEVSDIYRWIKARYPSMPASAKGTVRVVLSTSACFTNIRSDKGRGRWMIGDLDKLIRYLKRNVFLKLRSPQSATEQAIQEPSSPTAGRTVSGTDDTGDSDSTLIPDEPQASR